MQSIDSEFTDNSISDAERLQQVLKLLSLEQIRFIVARQNVSSDKEAAETIGLKPDTVYRWPAIVGEAALLMARDGIFAAAEIRRRHLTKAMLIKVSGLDSKFEKIKQAVATEIIEWEMGKAMQRQELSGKDGGPIAFLPVVMTEDVETS